MQEIGFVDVRDRPAGRHVRRGLRREECSAVRGLRISVPRAQTGIASSRRPRARVDNSSGYHSISSLSVCLKTEGMSNENPKRALFAGFRRGRQGARPRPSTGDPGVARPGRAQRRSAGRAYRAAGCQRLATPADHAPDRLAGVAPGRQARPLSAERSFGTRSRSLSSQSAGTRTTPPRLLPKIQTSRTLGRQTKTFGETS